MKIVHFTKILGDNLDLITLFIKAYRKLEVTGKPTKEYKELDLEKIGLLLWQCRQEGWYKPIIKDNKLTFSSIFPFLDHEYIDKRDFIHTEQDYYEAMYYEGKNVKDYQDEVKGKMEKEHKRRDLYPKEDPDFIPEIEEVLCESKTQNFITKE